MSAFPKYDQYKDSGVEWLGEIPEHWEANRIFSILNQRVETGHGHLPILNITIKNGVQVEQFEGDRKKRLIEDRSAYKRANAGDIAYNTMRMWQGAVGDVPEDGLVSPAYVVARPIKTFNTRYYSYLFRETLFQVETNRHSYGIVSDRNRLYWQGFKNIVVPIPPKADQDCIVGFLDQKTAEIDALIAKKQSQIELLDEQKAILITRAVTRGLNPNAKLKPSGIEWIGEIPEGWEVRRYAHVSRIVRGGSPRPAGHPAFFSSEEGTPWITVGEVTKDKNQYLTSTREYLTSKGAKQSRFIEPGTLLLTNSGATLGVPKVTSIGGCINDGVLAFLEIDEDRCLLDYLYNHLSTLTEFYRDRLRQGSGQPNLNTDLVKDTSVALPPTREEQRAICNRILEITSAAAATALVCERQIQSLQSLRSTLIAHAVTGKIAVHNSIP